MTSTKFVWLSAVWFITSSVKGAPTPTAHSLGAEVLAALSQDQRQRAQFSFTSSERFEWDWLPGKRAGVALKEMNPHQRKLVHSLLSSVLSAEGKKKIDKVIARETLLGKIEKAPSVRDPENYFLAVFGKPAADVPWAFRFEGHHISLNFSMKGNQILSATPMVLGSNPATYNHGGRVDRVLAEEVDLAVKLASSLTSSQLLHASFGSGQQSDFTFSARAGNFTVPTARRYTPPNLDGICKSSLNAQQKQWLDSLIQEYTGNIRSDFSDAYDKVALDPKEERCFAWQGKPDGKNSFQYRLQGKKLLIEVNAVQDHGNHVHTVWRDGYSDFAP